jgi:SAM-dependent methyltransferase
MKKNQINSLKPRFKYFLRRILPKGIVNYLIKVRNFFYTHRGFNHDKAQDYELGGQIHFLETNREAVNEYHRIFEESKRNNSFNDYGLKDLFFGGSEEKWLKFCSEMKDKICLEIGSGPMGLIPKWHWVKNKILIEPLLNEYRENSLKLFGKTFFTDDIKLYSQEAEIFIKELDNKVDGCIVSTNALDHSDDPLKILENISRYATKGCRFLFWATLYYPHGHNEGHRNIVKTEEEFEKILENLGFVIESRVPKAIILDLENVVYGCVAKRV